MSPSVVTRRIATIAILCGFCAINSGCSVMMAARAPEKKNLSVLSPGASRSQVVAELGPPLQSRTDQYGEKDVFAFSRDTRCQHGSCDRPSMQLLMSPLWPSGKSSARHLNRRCRAKTFALKSLMTIPSESSVSSTLLEHTLRTVVQHWLRGCDERTFARRPLLGITRNRTTATRAMSGTQAERSLVRMFGTPTATASQTSNADQSHLK